MLIGNIYKYLLYSLLFVGLFGCGIKRPQNLNNNVTTTKFNTYSEDMLKKLKMGEDISNIKNNLASTKDKELEDILKLDEQRKAFWINVYNAYIIDLLKNNPKLFDDRGAFFTNKQIKIAGHDLSFDDIENGMIRKSQFKFGLGYVSKLFPSKFERSLRVDERDFRIHFAINCGAKSCPPVKVYYADKVEEQLQVATERYLKQYTSYNDQNNTVKTSVLMSWFRGDFGGKRGTIKILEELKLIPIDKKPTVEYGNYDWTLDINNFSK